MASTAFSLVVPAMRISRSCQPVFNGTPNVRPPSALVVTKAAGPPSWPGR
jgi:hypothetical protein